MGIFLTVIGVIILLGILGYLANSNTDDDQIPVHRREAQEPSQTSENPIYIYEEQDNRIAACLKIVGYIFFAFGILTCLFLLVSEAYIDSFWALLSGVISLILVLGFAEIIQQLHHINIRLHNKGMSLEKDKVSAND